MTAGAPDSESKQILVRDQAADNAKEYRRRMALTQRLVARIVAVPVLGLMLGGLFLFAYGEAEHSTHWGHSGLQLSVSIPGPASVPVGDLANPELLLTGEIAMSLGLLALIALPMITVLLICVDHLRGHRWTEALVAAGVLGILALGATLNRR